MKYAHQDKVIPAIAEKSKRDTDAVNAWIDNLKGVVVALEIWRSGQSGPYQDSITEGLLHLHQPNCLTTNAPLSRVISRDEARTIIGVLVQSRMLPQNEAGPYGEYLQLLEPHADPCGLDVYQNHVAEGLHNCWRFVIRHPYCD